MVAKCCCGVEKTSRSPLLISSNFVLQVSAFSFSELHEGSFGTTAVWSLNVVVVVRLLSVPGFGDNLVLTQQELRFPSLNCTKVASVQPPCGR